MSVRPLPATLIALAICVMLLPSAPSVSAAAGPTHEGPDSQGQKTDRTSKKEAALVDAIPTPRLRWKPCAEYQCTAVRLPLDYDRPGGQKVKVALLKVPAADPDRRIGSLFLNPGGPGGSGKGIAERAAQFLSPEVLDRFDLIGMDPRGTNDSTRLQCYPNNRQQTADTDVLGLVLPLGKSEEAAFRKASSNLAAACSTFGQPLASSMSTTEVARDMEVLRRAVGDRQLTYLGWSYGTYLGQMYANMFPDRVRAIAIDGVVDAVAWQGSAETAHLPLSMRIDSAAGSHKALTTVLQRCRRAGAPQCPIMPNPEAAFAKAAQALRTAPITTTDEEGETFQITYSDFIQQVIYALYQPEGAEDVAAVVDVVLELTAPQTSTRVRQRAATSYDRLLERAAQRRDAQSQVTDARLSQMANDYEVNAAISCSDSRNPANSRRWSQYAKVADRRTPYVGRFWLWNSAVCAQSSWRAFDEDAYAGPFDRRTDNTVLVVGNYYDPATNYDSAVAVARRMPNSRLLSSDSWGHTAYGTSACATTAVDAYLLRLTLPAGGTVCTGDVQPYTKS